MKKKWLNKKVKGSQVLKDKKLTVAIKEIVPAVYVSRFFKEEWEEAKKSLFFT